MLVAQIASLIDEDQKRLSAEVQQVLVFNRTLFLNSFQKCRHHFGMKPLEEKKTLDPMNALYGTRQSRFIMTVAAQTTD